MFFVMSFWLMNACFSGMMAFPQERQILLKERASGSYQLSAFFLAKTISEAPIRLLLPTIYLLISYWMAGLNPTAAAFFGAAGTMLIATLTGESLGRSEEHTSELQSLMRISYAVFCLKKKKKPKRRN